MLLAKSPKDGQPDKTLPAHTRDVLAAVEALFGSVARSTDFAHSWLRFFRLESADFLLFIRHLVVAAALHDSGKANDGMQEVLANQGEQVIYHEHLSGLMTAEREMQKWLEDADLDGELLLAAVLGHHLRVGHTTLLKSQSVCSNVVRLLLDDDDFKAVWLEVRNRADAQFPAPTPARTRWTTEQLDERAGQINKTLLAFRLKLNRDRNRCRLLSAVRAALIVADAVGSAVVRLPGDQTSTIDDAGRISVWIGRCFKDPLTPQYIRESIIEPRKAQLADRFKDFSDFQRGMVDLPSRVLLTAPCGSGKTLAAWKWIEGQVGNNRATRAIFLYPTRATATEGFRDYVSWAPEAEATLVSGTAEYDLQGMFESPDDPRSGRDYRSDPRLFALGLWSKRIFSATADQFLPFLQYGYGQVCLLPLLAESVLVIDEVHSFDESMFSTLKRFLKEFSVPVLCMTATLPEERRRELVQECGMRPYPETMPDDLGRIAEHPRYHVEWIDSNDVGDVARLWLEKKSRVLRVVNRVDDCRDTYQSMSASGAGLAAYCYHSRYRLCDRRERHNELIKEFQDAAGDKEHPRAILGVTTQVCEMSLDLDADVLITDVAPISSLIQRMGRCNRDNERMLKENRIGIVLVVRREIGREKPYEREDRDAAVGFVDELAGRDVSQMILEDTFKKHDNQAVEPDRLCPFLDSGPYAQAREESFRDIEEFTVPCVLDGEDLTKVLDALQARKSIDGFVLPVPHQQVANELRPDDRRFPRWLNVASAKNYDRITGFGINRSIAQREESVDGQQ
jgi:CRISPR-associated endonuclease/helicase Cas3